MTHGTVPFTPRVAGGSVPTAPNECLGGMRELGSLRLWWRVAWLGRRGKEGRQHWRGRANRREGQNPQALRPPVVNNPTGCSRPIEATPRPQSASSDRTFPPTRATRAITRRCRQISIRPRSTSSSSGAQSAPPGGSAKPHRRVIAGRPVPRKAGHTCPNCRRSRCDRALRLTPPSKTAQQQALGPAPSGPPRRQGRTGGPSRSATGR